LILLYFHKHYKMLFVVKNWVNFHFDRMACFMFKDTYLAFTFVRTHFDFVPFVKRQTNRKVNKNST